MPKKQTKQKDLFADLSWDDLNLWAGNRIVTRGKNYQRQGLVSELALTKEGDLISWVEGTHRYATRVRVEDGLPGSICTCPYEYDCKHGVATVLEYLEAVRRDKRVPQVGHNDRRLQLLDEDQWEKDDWDEEEDWDEDENEEGLAEQMANIRDFLQRKTKKQLLEVILRAAEDHPEIRESLMDRQAVASGDPKHLISRLRDDIRRLGEEPDWQYEPEGPDYLVAGKKMEMLLTAGHADAVLDLGMEMLTSCVRQIEQGFDEVTVDLDECLSVVLKALDQSSLDPADRLAWVVDADLMDGYGVFDDLGKYVEGRHAKKAWSSLADKLLERIKSSEAGEDFPHRYARNKLCDWIIHALERAGRQDEIIPLCMEEARETNSYPRLVEHLIAAKRYEDARQWVQEGIRTVPDKWAGIIAELRTLRLSIHVKQRNWEAVTAMQVEDFVRRPSAQAFAECKKAATKIKRWSKIRPCLLAYLEKGTVPWKQRNWNLQDTELPAPNCAPRGDFPLFGKLIEIAVFEKKPDQVLRWYDRLPKNRFWGTGVSDDSVATAIQSHAPDRAVAVWQHMAENLIAQTKPSAYEEAVRYLRKAGTVMAKQKQKRKWSQYLASLRQAHARKRRFLELLDGMGRKPIVQKR